MTTRTNRTALVLFTGDPRREELCKHLPRRFLRAIHDHLTNSLETIPDSDLIIASTEHGRFRLEGPFGSTDHPPASLASQLDDALSACFGNGYERVLLLAGDVVDLDRSILEGAISILSVGTPRSVVGPSPDGGFYLAGFNSLPEIDWCSIVADPETAFRKLCLELELLRIPVLISRTIDDIDSAPDALRILFHPQRGAGARLRTLLLGMIHACRMALDSILPTGLLPLPARRLRAPPGATA